MHDPLVFYYIDGQVYALPLILSSFSLFTMRMPYVVGLELIELVEESRLNYPTSTTDRFVLRKASRRANMEGGFKYTTRASERLERQNSNLVKPDELNTGVAVTILYCITIQ